MSEVNPMTDLGVYTYKEVFEPTSEELQTPLLYQRKKEKFHHTYLLQKYSPGIHEVTGDNSIIKYFDIFSNAYIDYVEYINVLNNYFDMNGKLQQEVKKKYNQYMNPRIIKDKCYYDPIVTFVDTNNKYYNYNTSNKLPNGITIKLIIVQIAHIPFDYSLKQEMRTNPDYTQHGYFSYNGFYILSWSYFYSVWQIHALPQDVYLEDGQRNLIGQKPFYVNIKYTFSVSTKHLTFFNSVYYLPAYLNNDKNYNVSIGWIDTYLYQYQLVKVKPDAELPVFNVYKYPYNFIPFARKLYYFFNTNNDEIFKLNEKQQKLYYDSKILLEIQKRTVKDTKNNEKPKTATQIAAENELRIDEEMIQNSRPFVRINTKNHFIGENSRFYVGEHPFIEEQEVGSMVIYPGYEVQLRYKNIIRKSEMTDKGLVETKKPETTIRTGIYTGTRTSFKNAENMKGEKIKVLKLILRPQTLEFNNEYEKSIDEEYIRKNTKFVRIFPCLKFDCKSERYLKSSLLKSENVKFKEISGIILSPKTEVELITTKNKSKTYYNDNENDSKEIKISNNSYIELKLREYIKAQPSVSSMPYSNYASEENNKDPMSYSFVETENTRDNINDNDPSSYSYTDPIDTTSYHLEPIYVDDQSKFDNNPNLVNDNDKDNKNETKEENERDFSLFYIIITFIGMLILIVITVRVLKKPK